MIVINFHVTWHIIIGQKGGVCTTYAMNPRNLKPTLACFVDAKINVISPLFHAFVSVVVFAAPGPTCIPHEHDVCRTVGTIGMDWIYVDTATTDLESRVPDVNTLLGLAADFSEDCRDMFVEYICVSNFPSCDTSHVSPRPIEVHDTTDLVTLQHCTIMMSFPAVSAVL